MSPQALEAWSGCRNITLKVVFFLCSSFLLGAETVTKIFGVNWSYRKNTLDVYFLFFQGCEFPSRLLEVCVVMDTLSRVQEGKTSLWSNSADGSWKLGMGSSNNPRGFIPGSIPNYRRENSLSPGHLLHQSLFLLSACRTALPGAVSSQPRRKALPRAPCGAELQLCAIPGVSGLGRSRDVSNLCTDAFLEGTSSIKLSLWYFFFSLFSLIFFQLSHSHAG